MPLGVVRPAEGERDPARQQRRLAARRRARAPTAAPPPWPRPRPAAPRSARRATRASISTSRACASHQLAPLPGEQADGRRRPRYRRRGSSVGRAARAAASSSSALRVDCPPMPSRAPIAAVRLGERLARQPRRHQHLAAPDVQHEHRRAELGVPLRRPRRTAAAPPGCPPSGTPPDPGSRRRPPCRAPGRWWPTGAPPLRSRRRPARPIPAPDAPWPAGSAPAPSRSRRRPAAARGWPAVRRPVPRR